MGDSTEHSPLARRRSSLAYDPARDIFKQTDELPSLAETEHLTSLHEEVDTPPFTSLGLFTCW